MATEVADVDLARRASCVVPVVEARGRVLPFLQPNVPVHVRESIGSHGCRNFERACFSVSRVVRGCLALVEGMTSR